MNRAAPLEIEAKYLVANAEMAAPLLTAAELGSGYALRDMDVVCVVDHYVDTLDFRLLRRGYGLRIRQDGKQQFATLKSRGLDEETGIFTRVEIEEPLPAEPTLSPISGWPERIVLAIAPLLDGITELHTICRLEQTRRKRIVLVGSEHGSAGQPVAELSFDEVRIQSNKDIPPLAHYNELEIELLPGRQADDLPALLSALPQNLTLQPSPTSKLEHALAVIGRHPAEAPANWQGLTSNMHMAEACRLIWREQLTTMLLNEAGVRFSNDIEYVHDMRVATRRARAAAKLYGDYFRPKTIRRYLRGLQRTARLLGTVRDLDVAIARLEQYGGKSKKRQGATGQRETTLAAWREQRCAAHSQLLAWFDSRNYANFVRDFATFCASQGAGARKYTPKPDESPKPHQVRHVAPSMILNHFENVRSYETLFEGDSTPTIDVLHLLRIECKYLRYNVEFVQNLLGPQATELLVELRTLQGDLGDLNDAAVSKRMINETQDTANITSTGVSRYERAQERVIHKLSSKAEKHLRKFVSLRNRRRLALAIAQI